MMGSNIHISPGDPAKPVAKLPEDLQMMADCMTLPRFVGGWEFMHLVWDDSDHIAECTCRTEGHDYYCVPDTRYRPRDLDKLRQQVREKGLQDCFLELIDYLEAEPNAWIEYD